MKIAPHQKAFAKTARPYEGLWFGTGTGKTRTALHTVSACKKILVVAPKTSVQKGQWEHEAGVLGIEKKVSVISKEVFRRDYAKLPRYDAVIVDEAHNFFGVSPVMRRRAGSWVPKASQLFEGLLWYIQERKPDRLILATATPNKTPLSVWAAGELLGYGEMTYKEFRAEFYHTLPVDRVVYAPNRGRIYMEKLAAFTQRIGQVLRLEDIKDVPEQTFRTEYFEPTAAQKAMLKELPTRFTDQSSLRTKRHQVDNGVLYEDVFDEKTKKVKRQVEHIDNGKIDYILERAVEFPKMVIFANYIHQVEAIAKALMKEERIVYTLTGATKDRKAVLDQAEAAESAYVVAQASVSSEWEFKSCPVVIFASLSNRSIDYIQGQGRVQRYDAVKHNLYVHLITDYRDSIDRKWFETIMSGRDFNEALYEEHPGLRRHA